MMNHQKIYELLKTLDDFSFGKMYKIVVNYFDNGSIPELEGLELALFNAIKALIDEDKARREKLRENGRKGGRPKTKENQDITKAKPMVNQRFPLVSNPPESANKSLPDKEIVAKPAEKPAESALININNNIISNINVNVNEQTISYVMGVVNRLGFSTKRKSIKTALTKLPDATWIEEPFLAYLANYVRTECKNEYKGQKDGHQRSFFDVLNNPAAWKEKVYDKYQNECAEKQKAIEKQKRQAEAKERAKQAEAQRRAEIEADPLPKGDWLKMVVERSHR